MEDKLVTLAIHTYEKAQILKTMLETEGIEVYIHNVNQIQPVISAGVRVRIKESDLPHALRIIEDSKWLQEEDEKKPKEPHRFKVLIPVDFSDYSLNACEIGINYAQKHDAEVMIMHAYYSPFFPTAAPIGNTMAYQLKEEDTLEHLREKVVTDMEGICKALRAKMSAGELPQWEFNYTLREGLPEEEIIAFGKEYRPDLIVMGTRGKDQKDMQLQRLLSYTRKAVDEYNMIQEGDHIAVGISGGKDSLTLLYALHGLRRFYPNKFELSAITVDLGFDDFDLSPIQQLCSEMEVPYKIVKSDIYNILFNVRKESNPCSLCAKMRKGALNEAIKEMGCNKVAYAHHKDDIIETMLLSLIFEGRFHSFSPRTYLDRMDLTVIRPLMYVDEMDVIGFKNKYNLPVVKSKCPVDGYTKRQYAKDLLRQLNTEHPGARERMFHAILSGNLSGWPERTIRVREKSDID